MMLNFVPATKSKFIDLIMEHKIKLLREFPFFGILLAQLQVKEVPDEICKTMATDGKNLLINRDFALKTLKSSAELSYVLLHEVIHCALGHLWRRKSRIPSVWNEACDYATNAILNSMANETKAYNLLKMPKGCLSNRSYNDMTAEEIYSLLMDDINNYLGNKNDDSEENSEKSESKGDGSGKNSEKSESKDDDSGKEPGKSEVNDDASDGSDVTFSELLPGAGGMSAGELLDKIRVTSGSTPIDDHRGWDNSFGESTNGENQPEQGEDLENTWLARTISAHNTYGTFNVPKVFKTFIDSFYTSKHDWIAELSSYIEPLMLEETYSPPDARYSDFELVMPDVHQMEGQPSDIYVFSDSSGSVSETLQKKFLSELMEILNVYPNIDGHFGFWDTQVSDVIPLEEIETNLPMTAPIGGGTVVSCVFNYLKTLPDYPYNIKLIIIMTDGYFSMPPEEIADDIPVLWVTDSSGASDNLSGWGNLLIIEDD